jgi:hypothetical protein
VHSRLASARWSCQRLGPSRLVVRALHSERQTWQDDRFVPLTHSHANDHEVTVYIKGFMGANQQVPDFQAYLSSHRELRATLGWGLRVYGYRWEVVDSVGLCVDALR